MRFPIHQVDAFTDRVFSGNPAAVVLLPSWLDDGLLQAVAAENNLSETAFLVERSPRWELRWFTPSAEVDLCGHATLASAFVLFTEGRASGEAVEFETRQAGPLRVERRPDGLLCLDFPSRRPRPVPEDAALTEALEEALGARPAEVLEARDLVAVYENETQVRALAPRFDRISALPAFAVVATAPGDEADFVSRFFAPRVGVPEDPVTGSAHCTLVPLWSDRLGRQRLRARQVSDRGGELLCEARGERVLLAGRATAYLRGEIEVPDGECGSA